MDIDSGSVAVGAYNSRKFTGIEVNVIGLQISCWAISHDESINLQIRNINVVDIPVKLVVIVKGVFFFIFNLKDIVKISSFKEADELPNTVVDGRDRLLGSCLC